MDEIPGPSSRIPPHAKRVFEGVIFEVWQWEQEMFDGSTATFEQLRRPNTAQVIATVGDKILLIKEEQPGRRPHIALPGGRCDWTEDPLAAAKRELLEETGYASEDWAPWLAESPVSKIDWTIFTYIARNVHETAQPHLDPGEKISLHPVEFEEFLSLGDDPRGRTGEMGVYLLQARFDSVFREELRRKIFGMT